MVYTAHEKHTLDKILDVFNDYIQQHDSFDIVYSEKIGYIKLQVQRTSDAMPEVINTPESLLGILFNEIINDVIFSPDNPQQHHERMTMTEYEETESRRRITAFLEAMDGTERSHYLNYLDTYIKDYQEYGKGMEG